MCDELISVSATLLRKSCSADHARDFVPPFALAERSYSGDSSAFDDLFFDAQMVLSIGRYLRQVADAKNLFADREAADLASDPICGRSTDSRIDLIENTGCDFIGLAQHTAQRQHHPGKLATRRNPLEWARHLAAIGRKEQLTAIPAFATEPTKLAVHI